MSTADPCLTCGHEHRHHSGLANMIDCDIPGCSCLEFERTGPATPSTPTGAVAGPPDLAHAIQAMLRDSEPPKKTRLLLDDERAVLQDALEQLQATRDRLADLEGINATIGNDLDQVNAKLADYRARIESLCDRLASLQVYAAELRDLLEQVWELHGGPEGTALWVTQPFGQKIGAALQTDPPARGRAILQEVHRLREAIQEFLVQAPAGLLEHSSMVLLRAVLDLGAAREEDGG